MTGQRLTISVYIPSYNRRADLAQAIDSVLAQTRRPDEVLLLDDGSTDGSVELIREYEAAHPGLVRALHDGTNRGIGAVRRTAIEACAGDLITYVDGDDFFLPGKLEAEAAPLERDPELTGAYTGFRLVNAAGEPLGEWVDTAAPEDGDQFARVVRRDFPRGMVFRSELVRREALLAADPYPPGLNLYEDYDAKLRLTRHGRFACVPGVHHAYRLHEGGLSRVSNTRHFETLRQIFERNASLLDGLEPERAEALRHDIRKLLARTGWRAVKDERKSTEPGRAGRALRTSTAAARLDPAALRPKHLMRLARAVTGI